VRNTIPLPVTLYSGELYDQSSTAIIPQDPKHLPALWAFCSSEEFFPAVQLVDGKRNKTNQTYVKIPFDLAHWQKVAAEKYPHELPKPFSSDPTQWLFNGHPKEANQPLQVAVARLVGYQWPRQTGSSFPDCPALGPDGLEKFADKDGVVCFSQVRGEAPAAERVRAILAEAYGSEWGHALEGKLIAATGSKASSLEEWLSNDFFAQHCDVFHQRPFVWHLWDGRKDGFNVLVNYHKLAGPNGEGHRTLETLTHAYLGDWITRQKDAIGTLENSFQSTTARLLEPNWIEEDPDRFYIRMALPGRSGKGPIKVRVWTDSDGTDYDDDNRSSADSEVVDLIEEGTTGVFTSKSMLLTSNDGDDDHPVDGIADDAKNDRTRRIALGGQVKVELLEFKPAATYNAGAEIQVPIEKTVKVKVWVATIDGSDVAAPATVDADYKRLRESMAQVGVAVVRNATIVKFTDSDAGIELSPTGFDIDGSVIGNPERYALFDWIAKYSQRAADEISIIYVNYITTDYFSQGNRGPLGISYIPKLYSPAKYANHIVISASKEELFTVPHELLHVLMNAEHSDYPTENKNKRMLFYGDAFLGSGPDSVGIDGRKRISKRRFGKQKNAILASPYAQ
jgi:hypothetical protein